MPQKTDDAPESFTQRDSEAEREWQRQKLEDRAKEETFWPRCTKRVESGQIKRIRGSVKELLDHLDTAVPNHMTLLMDGNKIASAIGNYDAGDQELYKPRFEPSDEDPLKVTEVMESVMSLVALEEVKQFFLDMKLRVETAYQRKASLRKTRFNVVFQGNPGTGIFTLRMMLGLGISGMS